MSGPRRLWSILLFLLAGLLVAGVLSAIGGCDLDPIQYPDGSGDDFPAEPGRGSVDLTAYVTVTDDLGNAAQDACPWAYDTGARVYYRDYDGGHGAFVELEPNLGRPCWASPVVELRGRVPNVAPGWHRIDLYWTDAYGIDRPWQTFAFYWYNPQEVRYRQVVKAPAAPPLPQEPGFRQADCEFGCDIIYETCTRGGPNEAACLGYWNRCIASCASLPDLAPDPDDAVIIIERETEPDAGAGEALMPPIDPFPGDDPVPGTETGHPSCASVCGSRRIAQMDACDAVYIRCWHVTDDQELCQHQRDGCYDRVDIRWHACDDSCRTTGRPTPQ